MNFKKKEKAIGDYKCFAHLDETELTEKLIEGGYKGDEITEIIEGIKSAPAEAKFSLDELHETEQEDGELVYADCAKWDAYQKAVEQLPQTKQAKFIKVNATGCFRMKLNSKAVAVKHLVGIKIENEKSITPTRIDPQLAARLNTQIWNINNLPSNSIYYLCADLLNL